MANGIYATILKTLVTTMNQLEGDKDIRIVSTDTTAMEAYLQNVASAAKSPADVEDIDEDEAGRAPKVRKTGRNATVSSAL